MSDTPRTDAHTRQLIDTLQHPHWIEFARTLEREAVSLRNDLDALQHTLRGMEVQEERLKVENAALLKRLEFSDGWDDYNAMKTLRRENAALREDNAATQKLLLEEQRKATFLEKENFALRSSRDRMDWDKLSFENAALRSALEAITRRRPIMGSKGDYREGQIHALEACSEVARAALDAARKEQP